MTNGCPFTCIERQVEGLGQQVVQATLQRDQLRDELDRSIADLSTERDTRAVEVEERRRGETRLQAIEAVLSQLAPQQSAEEKP